MSPAQFHPKKEITTINHNNNGCLPPPLKINKESHFIKKSSSSSSPPSSSPSSSSTSSSSVLVNSAVAPAPQAPSNRPQQQRHPVIIYTHSPKVIHTHPRDFMALVQKLTGLSRSEEDRGGFPPPNHQQLKQELGSNDRSEKKMAIRHDDNVITEENNCSSIGENQVNSCFMAVEQPMLEPLNPYVTNLPVLPLNTVAEFICSNQPLMNYSDSLFFSIPSSTTLEGIKELHEF